MAPVAHSDDFDDYFSGDDDSFLAEVNMLDKPGTSKAASAAVPAACAPPWPAASKQSTTTAGNQGKLLQKDLFGKTITLQQPSTSSYSGQTVVRTIVRKQWDRTFYAKSGPARQAAKGKSKSKGKGKARAMDDDDEEDEDDDLDSEDEGNPLFDPEEARKPPKPMKLLPDREACKTFVYPINKQLRKYQYDIIAKAFFHDTLVALPTGLGKTFLAAVLMYNFHRWFPKGKIVFMAPSRPLVTQQIAACHGIVGIPLKDAVELTGKDAPERRTEAWKSRRVFYCTPQTVKNDLFKGRLDPSDIILMVVDEAHKATGDYAYCEVVRYMMQKNPHFRLLALTATPGSTAEVVQSVIDSLHIGHIEVRSDESFDTRQYIHNKRVDLVIIPVQGEIGSIRERFGGLMNILLKQVRDLVKTQKTDPTTMHPYLFQAANQLVKSSGKPWAYSVLAYLGSMARCISKLLEQSVDAFFEDFQALRKSGGKGKIAEVVNHRDFASIYRDTEDIINGRGFAGHPKMVKLAELVQEHFEQAKKDGTLDTTRIMVFCTFRQVVDEIVGRLNAFDGIRATRLVGQGTDSKGKKGLAQKQQNQTLAKFKRGDFNVLVATSIGEEGLDIGELDLIICYDAAKSPVRTLQRAGRTGRAREGRVVVLMTEGIEEDNWKIANSKYKDVQSAILSGKQFELYADGKRLIPDDIRPVADKKELTIEPFDPEHMGLGRKSVATGRRKKNEKDNLDLFETGFQKASGLKLDKKPIKAEAGHKKEVPSFSEPVVVLEGDGTLSEWEQALLDRNYSVSPSVSNARSSTLRSHSLPRTVPSVIPSSKRMLGTSARTAALFRAMQAGQQLCADSETNKAWEIETYSAFKSSNVRWWPEERVGTGRDKSFRILGSCDFTPTEALADGFSTGSRGATFAATASEAHALKALANDSSEDDLPDIALLSSKASMAHSMPRSSLALPEPTFSPPRLPSAMSSLPSGARGQRQAGPRSHMAHIKSANGNNTIITIDDSDTEVAAMEKDPKLNASKGSPKNIIENVASHAKPAPQASPEVVSIGDSFDEDLDSSLWLAVDLASVAPKAAAMSSAGEQVRPGSPQLQSINRAAAVFGPPNEVSVTPSEDSPIVAPRRKTKRIAIVTSSPDKTKAERNKRSSPAAVAVEEDDSVILVQEHAKPKRLRRAQDEGEIREIRRTKQRHRPDLGIFLDTAAVNSDNEDTASDTDEDIEPETTSDRVFLDSEDISNPRDMSMFYRESLMSQVPGFHGEVIRPGAYKMRIHRARMLDRCEESPVAEGESRDQTYEASQYERGSFCVDDSDEVVYSQREDAYLDDD